MKIQQIIREDFLASVFLLAFGLSTLIFFNQTSGFVALASTLILVSVYGFSQHIETLSNIWQGLIKAAKDYTKAWDKLERK